MREKVKLLSSAGTGHFYVAMKNKRLHPEKRNYLSSQMPMTETAIDTGFTRDLYVSLGEPLDPQCGLGVQHPRHGERREHRRTRARQLTRTAPHRVGDQQDGGQQLHDEDGTEQAGRQRPYRPPSDPERAMR